MNLKNWISLTRAEHAVMVVIAIVASEFVTTKTLSINYLLTAIGPALITLGAFAWNDYFGFETDKAMKRLDRPIVNGKISKNTAFNASILLMAMGILASAIAGIIPFAISAIFAILSMLYDPILKKKPLIGNVFIASSMGISFIYGNYAVSSILNLNVILYTLVSLTAGLGRELILTMRDIKGDTKIGARTLPMVIGTKATTVISSSLLHLSVALSLFPLFEEFKIQYALLVLITGVLLIYSAWKLALGGAENQASLKQIRNYTLYALFFGILAFASLGT